MAQLDVTVKETGISQTDAKLNKLAQTADRTEASANRVGKSFGKIPFGQIGYQVQDLTTQLQMGTSAFVAIGQQGSQLAGAFGPGGAVIGAVIALGSAFAGTLYNSMNQASTASDRLKDATKGLNDIITETDDGVEVLTERIIRLAQANETAARAEISLGMVRAKDVINAASDAIGNATKQVDGWTNTAGSLGRATNQLDDLERITKRFGITQLEAFDGNIPAAFQMKIEDLSVFMNTLGKEYGLTKAEALSFIQATDTFNKQRTPENAAALADNLAKVATTSQTVTPEFIKFTAEVGENARKMTDAKDKTDALKSAQQNLVTAITQSSIAMGGNSRSLEGWVVSLENSLLRGNDALKAKRDQTVQDINNNAQLDEQQKARALKAAEDLYKLEASELDKRGALREQKHSVAIQKQEDRSAEELERNKKAAADYITQLQQRNMSELALIDAHEQEKIARLAEYRNQGAIAEDQFAAARKEAALTARNERMKYYEDEARKQAEIAADAYKAEQDRRKEEQEQRDKNFDNWANGQQNLTDNIKATLGEQNAAYKAAAIISATIDTYKAATGAYASLSSIPYVGPGLGIAAAGAALAFGFKQVQAITGSGRMQGGQVAAGDVHMVGERGPELVQFGRNGMVTPNSALGGATTTQQVVNVHNYAGTAVSTQQNSDGSTDIFIRKDELADLLASQAGNPNSKMNRAQGGVYERRRA